jgi:DNA polymerase-4
MTTNIEAIRRLFQVNASNDTSGNLPAMPGIYPDYSAPIVRNGASGREIAMARWGMPSSQKALMDATKKRAEKLQAKGKTVDFKIAFAIRARIKAETGLNASAGISYNKFLAKLASDHRKPNGQYVITPEMGPGFVEALPVGKFHGIGPATNAKMQGLGIFTGQDLRNQELTFLEANFGKAGAYYYSISRGIDERPVRANRIRKSVGAGNTFASDLTEFEPMAAELHPLVDTVWRHCESTGNRGRTVTLKVKFADFEIISRSQSFSDPVSSRPELELVATGLLQKLIPLPKAVRLLGVSLSALQKEEIEISQMCLPL